METDRKDGRGTRIAFLLLFSLIPIGLAYYYTRPDPGIAELKRSREAVRAARSWHSHEVVKTPGGTIAREETKDVSCPGEFRVESVSPNGQRLPGTPAFYRSTTIFTGGMFYTRRDDGPWIHNAPRYYSISQDCEGGPVVKTSKLFFDGDIVIATGSAQSGERRRVGDDLCRDYHISWQRSMAPLYTVCINEDDHLPREVDFDHGQWTYEFSAWNSPIVIAPPE